MKISSIHIRNYRNLEEVILHTNQIVILIGDNNGGKSNILRALTLPFIHDEIGGISKNLGWHDINSNAKDKYYEYIEEHLEAIKNRVGNLKEFSEKIPAISVEVTFEPSPDKPAEEYYVRNWISKMDGDSVTTFGIRYEYQVEEPKELLEHISNVLKDTDTIDNLRMNLLPIEFFKYQIVVPITGEKVSYTDLTSFKYNALAAERDEFSNKNSQLGSKALVNLLQNKLSPEQKVKVEQSYEAFFKDLKDISELDKIFNWQDQSKLENASNFFDKITLLPNIPSMSSLLNNVRLGYGDDYLNIQGLGYRNLIYLFVMMNSLNIEGDGALNLLTIEEPEAHLSVSNEHLLASFINSTIANYKQLQLFVSTHSSEFLNKLELSNVTIVAEGCTYSLNSVFESSKLDYLAKKPNLDFLKFLYSRSCILVEGPTEEMWYVNTKSNIFLKG